MSNPAEGYESYMVPTLFGPWAERLVRAASIMPGARVLDLGCGTGIVARTLAGTFGKQVSIAGVDLNPDMLAVARAAAEREHHAIEWHEGAAERLPFSDERFDVVLCQFALMFFSDRPLALAEIQRVLAPHGKLMLSVWQGLERHPFYLKLHEVIQARVGISALADIFSMGNAQCLHSLLENAGFGQISIEPASLTARFPNPPEFLAGEIAVDTAAIPSMRALSEEARQSIVASISADMSESLAEVTQGDRVVLPFHAHIAQARR